MLNKSSRAAHPWPRAVCSVAYAGRLAGRAKILAISQGIPAVFALQPIPTQGSPHRGDLISIALIAG